MKLLAIDTSTDACSIALSVALGVDGDIRERHEIAPRRHGALVLPLVDELMAEAGLEVAQLDAVVLGRGPGSFTGLRIGAGVVQGIAFAAELPVACVSSLAILAQGVDANHVICVQDARMGEVYVGVFERVDGLASAVAPEQVCAPEAVSVPADFRGLGAGSGFEGYGKTLRARRGDSLVETDSGHRYPRARDALNLGRVVLEAGGGVEAAQALPVYLRDEVAHRGGGQ
jgi:tRNA threonylcarbamoyladenosine biosynthesis protein TsaB